MVLLALGLRTVDQGVEQRIHSGTFRERGLPMHDVLTRINDCDGHEMVPSQFWGREFGELAGSIVPFVKPYIGSEIIGGNSLNRPDVLADDREITNESVWSERGAQAPGAIDMKRRLEVLDTMGVRRQLIFPTFGLVGALLGNGEDYVRRVMRLDTGDFDVEAVGRTLTTGANDWALRAAMIDPDRIRAVSILPVSDLDSMMAEARRVVAGGSRAAWISSAQPPAGLSPADPALDEFWSFAAESDLAVLLHIGGDFGGFFKTAVWSDAPTFTAQIPPSLEIPGGDVYSFATAHMSVENYLITMVLGGVFERHPNLRFGVMEYGANWVGHLMETLDMWMKPFPNACKHLTMRPTEYFKRNVRVTPFYFEPLDRLFAQYPDMIDVCVFGSDYPHVEGGRHSHTRAVEMVQPFGDEALEKYFVTNAELLMPH
jgi:predicted TIM-barrel fold metal-dependent hydrolase